MGGMAAPQMGMPAPQMGMPASQMGMPGSQMGMPGSQMGMEQMGMPGSQMGMEQLGMPGSQMAMSSAQLGMGSQELKGGYDDNTFNPNFDIGNVPNLYDNKNNLNIPRLTKDQIKYIFEKYGK